jgi:hypothetical protein
MKYYSYSMALQSTGDLGGGNNMALGLTYAASEQDAVANIRRRAASRGIEIGFFEDGHSATLEPTGGFAKELTASANAQDRCIISGFEGTPHRH